MNDSVCFVKVACILDFRRSGVACVSGIVHFEIIINSVWKLITSLRSNACAAQVVMCGTVLSGYPRHQCCSCQIAFFFFSTTITHSPWGLCCQIMRYFPPSVWACFYGQIRHYFPSLFYSGMGLQGANKLLRHSQHFWVEADICKLATNCAPVITRVSGVDLEVKGCSNRSASFVFSGIGCLRLLGGACA